MGVHLSNLLIPRNTPLALPYFETASCIYVEHVGSNLHTLPVYGEKIFLYIKINFNKIFFKITIIPYLHHYHILLTKLIKEFLISSKLDFPEFGLAIMIKSP